MPVGLRYLQRLARNKAKRTLTGNGAPKPNEGDNGDFRLQTVEKGVKLYAKHNNKWYAFTPDNETVEGVVNNKDIEENGYETLSSGLIIQWGLTAGSNALECHSGGAHSSGHRELTFNIPFPNNLFTAYVGAAENPGSPAESAAPILGTSGMSGSLSTYTNTEKLHFHTYSGGTYSDAVGKVSWIAIGN